jgi:ABC-2 type transport system permease protein
VRSPTDGWTTCERGHRHWGLAGAAGLLLLLAGGAVVVPAHRLPTGLSHVAAALPSGALGEAMRAALGSGRLALGPLLVLLAWAAAGSAAAVRWFRWD